MNTLAILVAAGRGERMGADCPKAFVELAGEPLLLRAARAFEESEEVDGMIAVVPAGWEPAARGVLGGLKKLRAVVPGGERRQDSVAAGLDHAGAAFDGVVLVHDAARPLVSGETIALVARAARDQGAALPVLEMVDTVKRIRDGRVVETLDRRALGAAQTPQGFRVSLLREAYLQADRRGLQLTDEAMAVEALGKPVAVVPGRASNRKLTTPEDLEWAQHQLRRPVSAS
jgi:2-C-methyl-D-erythritol 4-phosphate cytidylyltransferase